MQQRVHNDWKRAADGEVATLSAPCPEQYFRNCAPTPGAGVSRLARVLLVFLGLLSGGCAGGGAIDTAGVVDGEGSPLHALMVDRMRQEFAALNVLLFDLHRTEDELDVERERQMLRIREASLQLAADAREVGAMQNVRLLQSLYLDPQNLPRFRELATQLERQAMDFADIAERGALDTGEARRVFEEVNGTCNTCHALFRDRELAAR